MSMLPTDDDINPEGGFEMPRRSVNLRTQVAMLLALATLPVGVLAVAQGLAAFRETQVLRLAAIARESIEISREERGAVLEAFGSIIAIDPQIDFNAPHQACSAIARNYVRTSEKVSFLGVFVRDGSMFCGDPYMPSLNLRETPEFKRFLADPRRTVTAYEQGAVSGVPVLVVSAPLWRDGEVVASIAASLPSHYLQWVDGEDDVDVTSRFAIVGADGARVVAHGGRSSDENWLPSNDDLQGLFRSETPQMLRSSTGERRIFSATPLFKEDVYAVASWPQSKLTRVPSLVQFATLVLPIVMWALAVFVAYYAVDRFALRHVLYLDRLVTAYGRTRRKLRARGVRQAPQEFAQLGASFDAMATEIENRENALRTSLDEKNVLLKEVYHRVKNNLQLIVSLISMQLREVQHERERDGLMRLQSRVHSLATVHQRLYEAESLNAVRIDNLIRDIATNAKGSRGPEASDIALHFDMLEQEEPPERALPIALFATEAITNAFKHSLEFGTQGWLNISLRMQGEELVLEIANKSEGPANSGEPAPRVGLGTQLIEGFTRQLQGRVERHVTAEKFTIKLTFPKTSPHETIPETQI